MTIVYLDPVFPALRDLICSLNDTGRTILFAADYKNERLASIIERAEYVIVATAPVDRLLIEKAKRLKHIQKTGVGVDNIDIEAAKRRGITVANTPGANATGVAELTILHILALYRKLTIINDATKKGEWPMWEHRLTSFELHGKTHGLFGFGKIGQETAKRSKAFGTKIIYHDVKRASPDIEAQLEATYVSKEELLKTADIISLHIPLLLETKDYISDEELKQMKNTAILINVSRGGIVNEGALVRALRNGEIMGAGIDVWSDEPPESNHPLFQFPQVIATPHIGAGTKDTLERVLRLSFQNIRLIDEGKQPRFLV